MIEHALNFITHYGYFGILFILGLGMLGIPLPEETLLTFFGFLVSTGRLEYFPTIFYAFLGSTIGMAFSFSVGKYLGLPFLNKYGSKIGLTEKRLKKTEKWFNKFGKFTVTFGYFIPGLRHFTAYMAGISKWDFKIFAIYALPGGLVWTTVFVSLGDFLGDNWHIALKIFHKYIWEFVVILIILGGIYLLFRNRKINKLKGDRS